MGCDELKQLLGQVVVSVENATTQSGFRVSANGEHKFDLVAGEKKSFSVNTNKIGSVRIVVSHTALSTDLTFTVLTPGNDGGSAALLISKELFLGSEIYRLTCPGCESLLGHTTEPVGNNSTNPLK